MPTLSLFLVQLHMTVSLLGNAYTDTWRDGVCACVRVHFHMGFDCMNACLRSGTITATCPHAEGHTQCAERFN